MTDLAVIATLSAVAAGGTFAGRAVAAVDARLSGVTRDLSPAKVATGAAGAALVALALAAAPGELSAAGVVALGFVGLAAGLLGEALRIVAAEERRERMQVRVVARRRARRRRAA